MFCPSLDRLPVQNSRAAVRPLRKPLAQDILANYTPRASVVPGKLDFTECPYAWPFCRQPLYAGAMPLMFNATVLNGMGLTGAGGALQSAPFCPFLDRLSAQF